MLRSVQDAHKHSILANAVHARDGRFGRVAGLFFDDQSWAVRYLVVATGGQHDSRLVLIAPEHLDSAEARSQVLRLSLDRKEAEKAPGIEQDPPVAGQKDLARLRTHEAAIPSAIHPWPTDGMTMDMPPAIPKSYVIEATPEHELAAGYGDPCLRSTDEVVGYRIRAADGEAGHVEDFLVDDEAWEIRYLAIDTRDWLPAKKVLLPARLISRISRTTGAVGADVGKYGIRQAPEWDPLHPVDSGYETAVREHYGHVIGESA